jgi:DNA invertase Pin-like site-specific DNA recombinase
MKIGYIRVSTKDQTIDRQIDMLKKEGCEKVFVDRKSGKNRERPELKKMFEQFREGDILIITELSRFGRSLIDVLELARQLRDMKVELVSITQPVLDTTTPQGKLFFYITAMFDEMRREITVQNTKEGLEAARARGKKGGRPPVDKKTLETAIKMYDSRQHTIKEITQLTGISQGTLYKNIRLSEAAASGEAPLRTQAL